MIRNGAGSLSHCSGTVHLGQFLTSRFPKIRRPARPEEPTPRKDRHRKCLLLSCGAETPSRRRLGWILALLAFAQCIYAIDYSIVFVALPDIGSGVGFSAHTLQWVVSAYAVAFGGFLLLGGRAADLFGRRRVFAFGLFLYAVSSLMRRARERPDGPDRGACCAGDRWRFPRPGNAFPGHHHLCRRTGAQPGAGDLGRSPAAAA